MGYKLAGYEVVGANDIDPEMAEVYKANHKPKHYYLMPIGQLVEKFRREGVPDHLRSLDILDGSPPCSSFSTSGNREQDWGKDKRFREGQAQQVLDDLFFDYLNLLEIIQPRTFIAENVPGILMGKAKGYAKAIVQKAREIGYATQVFEVDATACKVPQSRKRVFFVGTREERSALLFNPNRPTVCLSSALEGVKNDPLDVSSATLGARTETLKLWKAVKPGRPLKDADPNGHFFTFRRARPDWPSATVVAYYGGQLHWEEPRRFTWKELLRIGSFPDDYNLCKPNRKKWNEKACYLVGMSVPPFMIRDLSTAIYEQWLA
jgi:DNA (cytosine-5)-methyltransferase 1